MVMLRPEIHRKLFVEISWEFFPVESGDREVKYPGFGVQRMLYYIPCNTGKDTGRRTQSCINSAFVCIRLKLRGFTV